MTLSCLPAGDAAVFAKRKALGGSQEEAHQSGRGNPWVDHPVGAGQPLMSALFARVGFVRCKGLNFCLSKEEAK